MDTHCTIGEMYLEYLAGVCKTKNGKLCDFCNRRERCCDVIASVARPFPDSKRDGLHYLPLSITPTSNRSTDDFMPRTQLKAYYDSGECKLDDPDSVSRFSRKFVVAEDCVKQYLEHLRLLDLKKDKRTKERKAQKAAEASKTYDQYNWHAMFNDGSLRNQTNAVLEKYLKYHHLPNPSNKRGKVNKIQQHILNHQRTQNATVQGHEKERSSREDDADNGDDQTDYSSDNDDDERDYSSDNDETDYVVAEIGSSSEDDGDGDDNNNIEITVTTTRSGRKATRYLL